jgi:DNA-binding XRE family transcriptional regulator
VAITEVRDQWDLDKLGGGELFRQLHETDSAVAVVDWRQTWGKRSFLRPFCQLLIKAIRHDSPPIDNQKTALCKLLDKRLAAGLRQKELSTTLGVSVRSLKNWEHNSNLPTESLWPQIQHVLGGE